MLRWWWVVMQVHSMYCYSHQPSSCSFNSMCTCSSDQHDLEARSIRDVSCLSVPFYKFPDLPEGLIGHLELADTQITSLETESLAGSQVQSLTLSNNRLQHMADKAFGASWKSLTSLDLSYNELDSIPFVAFKELRNLQWINLHGNQICTMSGDWSHLKNTVSTLFLGENDITEIPADVGDHLSKNLHGLHKFKSLIWLNLDGNRISQIHKHSLPVSLQTFSISHNIVEDFPLDLISKLPHLQWLYLRGNHIKVVPEHTFTTKPWLEKIDLGENYLRTLPNIPFNNSVYIRDLNLAFNDFTTLTANSFNGLQCGRIILAYNHLENIQTKAFNGIQESLEYLDFDHNNFQHVPEAVSQLKSLKFLYLSSNNLSEVPETAFENFYSTLKALSLSGNRFSRIPSEALQNCTRISHFNMAYNEISELNQSDFSNWGSNIRSLILVNNRITTLTARTFEDLHELKELSISFNPLHLLDHEAFVGLSKLESLEMSFGLDRNELASELFIPLQSLKWLSIDNNNIHTLSENMFDNLPQLIYLNLESNHLRSIPVGVFKPSILTKLKDLRLCDNAIELLHSDTFKSLPSLETLLLSNNKIRNVQTYSFNDLSNLQKIILSDNLLSHISPRAFANLPALTKLDFQNNLLTEFSFSHFANISNLLQINISRNEIAGCDSDSKILNIEIFDLRFNSFKRVPQCLNNIALLRKLYLDYNSISDLEQNSFMHLTSLEYLSLRQNNIMRMHRRAFFGLQNLQELDLSKNLISQLRNGQFSNLPRLRILKLTNNNINYLPKDIFSHTLLEMLDLSYNSFSVVPSSSLSEVGLSLRHFSISYNNLEHIDSTVFPDIPFLQHLDLSSNKLTILPDNVFTSLGLLQKLDLSSNPLRANFKELFHYAQNLKELNLANTGIIYTPHLPLPFLNKLNLSHNLINTITKNSVQELQRLKHLDLSDNKFTRIPSNIWLHLPVLKTVDLSNNPIKGILSDSFNTLPNLQDLKLFGLKNLQKFESKALSHLRILKKLSIQTWPTIDNYQVQFCNLMANLNQIQMLHVYVEEEILDQQLLCLSNRKIRHLEITGANLKSVDKNAFAKLTKNPDLLLKIVDTHIEELPAGLFANMYKISYLSIDLRNNMLSYLSPEIFYGNSSTWKSVGATLISGSFSISNNPFKCGCHLAWLGHWLRRWLRESLQSHNTAVDTAVDTAVRLNNMVKEGTCTDSISGIKIPIIQLPPEDLSCHASALSTAPNLNKHSVIFVMICYVIDSLLCKLYNYPLLL